MNLRKTILGIIIIVIGALMIRHMGTLMKQSPEAPILSFSLMILGGAFIILGLTLIFINLIEPGEKFPYTTLPAFKTLIISGVPILILALILIIICAIIMNNKEPLTEHKPYNEIPPIHQTQ